MAADWRFEKSPHVEIGGLRSYAGVPLKFETEFGQHVAFGSLCVASNSPQEQLAPSVQQSLVRLADAIVSDIVHSARARRQRERRRMLELICDAQRLCDEHANMEEEIPKIFQEIYSDMEVAIKRTTDGIISFEGGTSFSARELEQSLWEDTEYFDYAIKERNHLDMMAPRPVRAVAVKCASQCVPTFLVVACNVWLAIIWQWTEHPVMLEFVLQFCKLGNDMLALFYYIGIAGCGGRPVGPPRRTG